MLSNGMNCSKEEKYNKRWEYSKRNKKLSEKAALNLSKKELIQRKKFVSELSFFFFICQRVSIKHTFLSY